MKVCVYDSLCMSIELFFKLFIFQMSPGFLRMCDSTAQLQLYPTTGHAHSPSPKHASFLRVTEWVRDEDTPTTPTNQSRADTVRESRTQVRPDCYKHFTPRFRTSELDQVIYDNICTTFAFHHIILRKPIPFVICVFYLPFNLHFT